MRYDKLVRDKIPELIRGEGRRCTTRTLAADEYILRLDQKLNEEVAEYQQSKSMEELADVLEVLRAVAQARGYSFEDVERLREAKARERGGFTRGVLLIDVAD